MLTFLWSISVRATHSVGAELTWECQGNGSYVFELVFYRDCNGFEVNVNAENLRVWGHPSINNITVNFVERIDISPYCSPAGGIEQLSCGVGAEAGNGPGAVERVVYRSQPIVISGTPPASGWFFTYENFSRSGALTNVENPLTKGITITAAMYPILGAPEGQCMDSSPAFLQEPFFVSCTGDDYSYNPNGVDADLDSLVFSWGTPLDHFPDGAYNPPINPEPITFENGFSFNNPTPDQTFNPNNVPATIDAETGQISFNSAMQGNFASKLLVDSYRNGRKIATVEREMQFIVVSCDDNNNFPQVTPPFNGGTSYETTVFAGEEVSFTLASTDVELLQDGTPQQNIITASGLVFGDNFTDANSGCDVGPCATLNSTLPVTGSQGATVDFNWQTSCDHLVDATGNARNIVPYTFVFRVQDDYCAVPKVRYETVVIYVLNQDIIPAPSLTCITTNVTNDIELNWSAVDDPNNAFEGYSIVEVGGGEVGFVADRNTTTFTVADAGGSGNAYTVGTVSGCEGNTIRYSDTIRPISLELNNPNGGVALLNWNRPKENPEPAYGDYFHIYREYPVGTWTLIDSVNYNTTNYRDTITICEVFYSYKIVLPTSYCDFESNVEGDNFEDKIVPTIPVIEYVSIDTLTNEVTISWNENPQKDTYGYVVYTLDENNFLIEIDTVWGIDNTSYTHLPDGDGTFEYSVAAFDSCFTDVTPPTHQTSAKATVHRTMLLRSAIDACEGEISFNWTSYIGFDSIAVYEVWGKREEGDWEVLATTNELTTTFNYEFGTSYIYAIRAVSGTTGFYSFSNTINQAFEASAALDLSYLSVASVEGEGVLLQYYISEDEAINYVEFERYNQRLAIYETIAEATTIQEEIEYYDQDVEVNRRTYRYRVVVYDTCDQILSISNEAETIFLEAITDEAAMTHTLQWSPYSEYMGDVVRYRVFRGIDGEFDPTPIAETSPTYRMVMDTVTDLVEISTGKTCYLVEAIPGDNEFGIRNRSKSNIICPVLPPLIYIPNAFSLGGQNPIFKPETRLRQFRDYRFTIFDRYGQEIYHTNDPNEGWDGRIKGTNEFAKEGMYIYRLAIRDGNNQEVLRHGHVTLLDYR